MDTCPHCGSYQVESNKFETVPFTQISPGVEAMRGQGHPLMAITTVFCWMAGHALNAVIDDWRCKSCGARFS